MSDAKKLAVEFFKRNTKATVAHVVLDSVTDDLKRATLYQKTMYARKVTTYLRQECEAELGESGESVNPVDINTDKKKDE